MKRTPWVRDCRRSWWRRTGLAPPLPLAGPARRKAGIGENFWQFRRYGSADSVGRIDWRQSAKSQHLFVREREWEAAEAVWLWRDGSPGMRFKSEFSETTKIDSASLLALPPPPPPLLRGAA